MMLHLAIILCQAAALAAFLVLWYFWVRKKLLSSYVIEDEEQILFPFRYFSWILLGTVLVTCLAQTHFTHTSARLEDRLVALTQSYKQQEQLVRSLQESSQVSIQQLRKDTGLVLQEVRSQATRSARLAAADLPALPAAAPVKRDLKEIRPFSSQNRRGDDFAGEARASSSLKEVRTARAHPTSEAAQSVATDPGYSMQLSLVGRVTADSLRVRKQPNSNAPVVEKLKVGEQVKVTEKRLFRDSMWFRVVTPSGRAGWVDYRYLKLSGEA